METDPWNGSGSARACLAAKRVGVGIRHPPEADSGRMDGETERTNGMRTKTEIKIIRAGLVIRFGRITPKGVTPTVS